MALVHDYGDLRVGVQLWYEWRYDDSGCFGAKGNTAFWHPNNDGDLSPLGSIMMTGYYNSPNNRHGTLIFGNNPKNTSARPAVARPTGYTFIWNDQGTRGKHDGSLWRPTAPSGYTAMGDVVNAGYSAPSTNNVWCIRSDLVKPGVGATSTASTNWFQMDWMSFKSITCTPVVPQPLNAYGAEKLPVSAGAFFAGTTDGRSGTNSTTVCFVPTLEVKNEFKELVAPMPTYTKDTLPTTGTKYDSFEQCKVTLPYTAFFDPEHVPSLTAYKTTNNPFITVGRSIAWYVEGVWQNDTDGNLKREKLMKYGISTTDSTEITHSVGISISATAGIGVVESSITLNYQFTHTDTHSFTEYSERQTTESNDVPAHTASVLFSKHIVIKAYRGEEKSEDVLGLTEIVANDDVHWKGIKL